MFLGDGVRSILHRQRTFLGINSSSVGHILGIHGRSCRSSDWEVGDSIPPCSLSLVGSTPVLKIALPSSPLPELIVKVI